MKKWYQSKTIWVAIVTAIMGIGQAFTDSGLLSENITAMLLTGLGVLHVALRTLTDTRIAN
jgi:L-asparaginase/Glu-tRNA(Gln) amidotransferase subunit D